MQKINFIKRIALCFIILFILGIIVSQIFDVDFVERHIEEDGRIGEHVKIMVSTFQNQMFYE